MSRTFQVIDLAALTDAMSEASLSQADIADALEVARSTVARWVTGETQPSDDNLVGLAGALGVTEGSLLWPRGLS